VTPSIGVPEVDENNNFGNKSKFMYNSDGSIFNQLEHAYAEKLYNESCQKVNHSISNGSYFLSISNQSSENLRFSSNLNVYKKMMLRKNFFK